MVFASPALPRKSNQLRPSSLLVILLAALVVAVVVHSVSSLNSPFAAATYKTTASDNAMSIGRKLDAVLVMENAIQEVGIARDLHWDLQIKQVQDVAKNWQSYGFTAQEIISLFSRMGQMLQMVYCFGKTRICYDGGATTQKSTVYVEWELQRLAQLAGRKEEPVYCETGFNFGKSTMAALLAGFRVYSFDVQKHDYSDSAAKLVDMLWPGRFTMNKGSSFETVPAFHKSHPDIFCDVISVDGMHTYDGVYKDLKNLKEMSRDGALVFVDDIGADYNGGGLFKAWEDLKASGDIKEDKYIGNGHRAFGIATLVKK